jgi:RNA polymerase subunit RPABC4/transcription elongation factor Spt4
MSTKRSKFGKAARAKRANNIILTIGFVLVLLMIACNGMLKSLPWGATVLTIGWIIAIPAIVLSVLAKAKGKFVGELLRGVWGWFCELVNPKDEFEPEADKRVCAKCGKEVPEDQKCCGECGTKYEPKHAADKRICAKCGKEVPEGLKCCGECGTKYEPKPVADKRICAKCGKEVPEGLKCCGECGTKYEPKPKPAPVKRICAKCGKEVPEGQKCCGECGTKYEPKPAATK